MTDTKKERLSITQASKMYGERSRQAVYQAIRKGRLKAFYEEKQWWITKADLITYNETKYSRMETKFQGAPLYNMEEGEISVGHAAKMCGLQPQHIYYQLRRGTIQGFRRGDYWVLNQEQVASFYRKMLEERENPKQLKFA